MKRVLSFVLLMVSGLVLLGCAEVFGPMAMAPGPDTVRPMARPSGEKPPANARTAEEFDTTSASERAAAAAAPESGAGSELGRTIASLGNPAIAGFWLETPLVSKITQGRVVYLATGKSIALELRPIEGPRSGGSRISLAAMRLLGVALTDLPELVVYGS